MALTVEDGTGKADAQAFDTVAAITTYCSEMGLTSWADLTDAQKEAAALRAMAFLDALDWHGTKTDQDNGVSWPRYGMQDRDGVAYDSDVIPTPVKKAFYEAAYIEVTAGTLQPTAANSAVKRSKTDVLEKEYFAPTGKPGAKIFYRLSGYLKGLGSGGPFEPGGSSFVNVVRV